VCVDWNHLFASIKENGFRFTPPPITLHTHNLKVNEPCFTPSVRFAPSSLTLCVRDDIDVTSRLYTESGVRGSLSPH
jgi:hypothetical protein